jgi:hypothetical protein
MTGDWYEAEDIMQTFSMVPSEWLLVTSSWLVATCPHCRLRRVDRYASDASTCRSRA